MRRENRCKTAPALGDLWSAQGEQQDGIAGTLLRTLGRVRIRPTFADLVPGGGGGGKQASSGAGAVFGRRARRCCTAPGGGVLKVDGSHSEQEVPATRPRGRSAGRASSLRRAGSEDGSCFPLPTRRSGSSLCSRPKSILRTKSSKSERSVSRVRFSKTICVAEVTITRMCPEDSDDDGTKSTQHTREHLDEEMRDSLNSDSDCEPFIGRPRTRSYADQEMEEELDKYSTAALETDSDNELESGRSRTLSC